MICIRKDLQAMTLNKGARKYRFSQRGTRVHLRIGYLVLLLSLASVLAVGCKGFADQRPDEGVAEKEGEEVAHILYKAMIDVFEEQTTGVDLKIEERWTVISYYEEVNEMLR